MLVHNVLYVGMLKSPESPQPDQKGILKEKEKKDFWSYFEN